MQFSDGRPVGEQIISGVRITLKFLIGLAVTGTMVYGLNLLFFPVRPNPASLSGRHPYALGAFLLTIVTMILHATIQRWVKILPGILGYCAFRALRVAALMLILGSRKPVPGSTVLFLTIVLLADTVLSITFVLRDLNLLDRFSLIGFVYCLGISVLTNQPLSLYIAPTAGSCLLLLAWLVERNKHPRMDHVPDLTELEAQRQWHLDRFRESTARRLRERRRGRGGLWSRFNLRF
jgi:hypothetical protein